MNWIFQSTLPVWGATNTSATINQLNAISIHAPRVGSDDLPEEYDNKPYISIHAPRVGSDSIPNVVDTLKLNFNPRSPCGERLTGNVPMDGTTQDFNPRSPCGERQ